MSFRNVARLPLAGAFCTASIACFLQSGLGARAQGAPLPPATVGATTAAPAPTGPTIARTITVTGSGVIRVKPAQARVVFLVSTTEPRPLSALQDNAKQVARVIEELRKDGVPAGNISWSESSLVTPPPAAPAVPQTTYQGGPADDNGFPVDTAQLTAPPVPMPAPQSFTANARVEVITYEVSDASKIVQIGMYGGATGVLGMTFEPRDVDKIKAEALVEAMKDAANKAGILAAGMKVNVLYAISAAELPASVPEQLGANIAPPAEVAVPMSVQIVYAIG